MKDERFALNNIATDEKEVIQAGLIQNFELTYELCWKFMKRWLELNLMIGLMDGTIGKELFRNALENKLISDFFHGLDTTNLEILITRVYFITFNA